MAGQWLRCPVGQEASTQVAIWFDPETTDIHVALTEHMNGPLPDQALVKTVAQLMERGLMQRVSPEAVSMDGESRN